MRRMNRAPIVLSATVTGLAATLGFQAHTPAATSAPAAQTTAAATATATRPSTAASTSARASATTSSTRTVTSTAVSNQYGVVQLKATVAAGKITKIVALQVPGGDPKSAQISAYAEPVLRASALQAQSASIDAVSGATYTSASYKTALQSVLDKAGIASSSAAGA